MVRKDNIKALLTQHQRRLQKLKEQQAKMGLNASPDILIEIEDIEAEIQHWQTELEAVDESAEAEEDPALGSPTYPTPASDVDLPVSSQSGPQSGDTITANISGDISGQVAVGKDIAQHETGCAQLWKKIFGNRR